jgi:phosphoglucomutase/phosphomannomutase
MPALEADGFKSVELYGPHAEPNGDFPNVPGHVSNPENPPVFAAIIERAKATGAELILATDPDCDRMGCAAPLTLKAGSEWATFTGNQLAALLCDYMLHSKGQGRRLPAGHYVVKTLVTTDMIRRIADSYGVATEGNLHVGFKYIGGTMDASGPEKFLFGAEESHGYLVGQYARDKDGAVACMLMAELAALAKSKGQSVHQKLASLYWQHGYHCEKLLNLTMQGSEGMAKMQALMASFRQRPPQSLGGRSVRSVRDYLNLTRTEPGGAPQSLDAPRGDMVILDFAEEGNAIAVRPSGTEPKVKFYMFSYVPPELLADLEDTRREVDEQMQRIEDDLRALAAAV